MYIVYDCWGWSGRGEKNTDLWARLSGILQTKSCDPSFMVRFKEFLGIIKYVIHKNMLCTKYIFIIVHIFKIESFTKFNLKTCLKKVFLCLVLIPTPNFFLSKIPHSFVNLACMFNLKICLKSYFCCFISISNLLY